MPQAMSCRHLNVGVWIQFQATPHGTCWGQSGNETGFSRSKVWYSHSVLSFNRYLYFIIRETQHYEHYALISTSVCSSAYVVIILSDKGRNKRPKYVVVNTRVHSVRSVIFAQIIRADIDSLGVFRLPPVTIIPPILRIHLLMHHQTIYNFDNR